MSMRISGLASGMNIDDIIAKLMKANRAPLEKLTQKRQVLEWKRDEYRTLNNKILELRNKAFDMRLGASYSAYKTQNSNESAANVTASPSASIGTYSLQVKQLASSASLTSTRAIGAGNEQMEIVGIDADTTLTITGNKGAATITVNPGETIAELVRKVNQQTTKTGVKANYDATLDGFFFTTGQTGSSSVIKLESSDSRMITNVLGMTGKETFTGTETFEDGVNQVIDSSLTTPSSLDIHLDGDTYSFSVNQYTTIGSLINDINGSGLKDAGVTAYINKDNQLVIEKPSGDPIIIDDNTGKLGFEDTGLSPATPDSTVTTVGVTGQDAIVMFNGLEGRYATNTIDINGLTITAKEVMATASQVTVTQDVDGVFENIKSFVDKYNEMIDMINTELSEKKYRDYKPLTEEQRKEMDKEDIERWEEKAKSGLLNGDEVLRSAIYSLRNALTNAVEGLADGDSKVLSDLGITTGSYLDKGRLTIDETKLRQAIAEKPEQIEALFTKDDGVEGAQSTDGLAVRLYQEADAVIEAIKEKAGTASSVDDSYSIGRDLTDITKQVANWQRILQNMESRYYKQFNAMEQAINQMNQQSAYLAQQFGGI